MEKELSLETPGVAFRGLRLLKYFVGEGMSLPGHLEVLEAA